MKTNSKELKTYGKSTGEMNQLRTDPHGSEVMEGKDEKGKNELLYAC